MASIGDRVVKNRNVMGVIKFIGEIHGYPNDDIYYGIELDDAKGDNNGGYIGNDCYFKCNTDHGVFIKASDIHYTQLKPTIIPNLPRVRIGDTIRCIKARCEGVIRFIGTTPPHTMKLVKLRKVIAALQDELEAKEEELQDVREEIAVMRTRESIDKRTRESIEKKQRIIYGVYKEIREEIAVMRTRESIDIKQRTIYGVELEKPYGNNDGTLIDRVYFQCAQDHGVFITHCDILQISISFNDEIVNHHVPKLSSIKRLISKKCEMNGSLKWEINRSSLLSYKGKYDSDIDIKCEYDFEDALQYAENQNLKGIILILRDQTLYDRSLWKFSVTQICDALKQWIYNHVSLRY